MTCKGSCQTVMRLRCHRMRLMQEEEVLGIDASYTAFSTIVTHHHYARVFENIVPQAPSHPPRSQWQRLQRSFINGDGLPRLASKVAAWMSSQPQTFLQQRKRSRVMASPLVDGSSHVRKKHVSSRRGYMTHASCSTSSVVKCSSPA
jgi:hypothetical protein